MCVLLGQGKCFCFLQVQTSWGGGQESQEKRGEFAAMIGLENWNWARSRRTPYRNLLLHRCTNSPSLPGTHLLRDKSSCVASSAYYAVPTNTKRAPFSQPVKTSADLI